jgi:S-adenosyl-L-methionine hydrolase (adenosine-forming)
VIRYAVTPRIITMTTDFGTVDAYVAIMKGVILSLAPNTTIVDLSHEVRPQYVSGAAYILRSAYRYFPSDAIHLAVVDPGVGTSRKALALRSSHGYFVGPDNGLFSPVLEDQKLVDIESGRLQGDVSAVELNDPTYWLDHVSQTFHGRDIFAPATAYLASGVQVEKLGQKLDMIQLVTQHSPVEHNGAVYGTIIHLDRFGNAVTNVPGKMLPSSPRFDIAGRTLSGLATSYQEERVVAILGSTGFVEIAARNASAADTLGLRVGDPLVVRNGS